MQRRRGRLRSPQGHGCKVPPPLCSWDQACCLQHREHSNQGHGVRVVRVHEFVWLCSRDVFCPKYFQKCMLCTCPSAGQIELRGAKQISEYAEARRYTSAAWNGRSSDSHQLRVLPRAEVGLLISADPGSPQAEMPRPSKPFCLSCGR